MIQKTHRFATAFVFGTLIAYAVLIAVIHPSLEQWPTLLVPFVTAFTVFATFFVNWKTSINLKSVDVLIHFNNMYDAVAYVERENLRNDPVAATQERIEQHYRRFWNLQLEQYLLFKKGFIDPDIFRYWMQCRFEEWNDNQVIGGISYKQAWETTAKTLKQFDFFGFMNRVFIDPEDALKSRR